MKAIKGKKSSSGVRVECKDAIAVPLLNKKPLVQFSIAILWYC